MAEHNLFPWIERRTGLTALAALLAFGGAAGQAGATVTSAVSGTAPNKLLTVTGDGADDSIAITCVSSNAKVNTSDPPGGPYPCADFGSMSIDGGAGADTIDLSTLDGFSDFTSLSNTTLLGGLGADSIKSSGAIFGIVTPGAGNDTVTGGSALDLVESGDTNMTLTDTSFDGGVLLGTDSLDSLPGATLTGGGSANHIDASGFTGFLGVSIQAGGGDDSVLGSQESDTLGGGFGNDTLDPQGGIFEALHEIGDANMTLHDTSMTGGMGTDTFLGGSSPFPDVSLEGGASGNIIDTSAFTHSFLVADGHGGDDSLKGNTFHELTGGQGNDTIQSGGTGSSVDVEADDTNFTLITTSGQNGTLSSPLDGNDTLTAITQVRLTGGAGDNNIDANAFTGFTTLSGGAGGDTLKGGSNDDEFLGEVGGNDSIAAGAGDDTLGEDATNFPGPAYDSFVMTNTSITGAAVGNDSVTGLEHIGVSGESNSNKVVDASAFSGDLIYRSGPGNDSIKGGNGNLPGTDDQILAGLGQDTVDGVGGDDDLEGNGLASGFQDSDPNTILGGDGLDTLKGDIGLDTFDGKGSFVGTDDANTLIDQAEGTVTVTNTSITSTAGFHPGVESIANVDEVSIRGGSGADAMNASAFDPTGGALNRFFGVTLDGQGGNDTFVGSHGQDSIDGGFGGTDRLVASLNPHAGTGGAPTDLVFSSAGTSLDGDDLLPGGLGDTLSDIEEASLTGDAAANKLDAGVVSFPVTLKGGPGADTLTGGSAADSLDGEGGVDEYNANAGDDTIVANDGLLETIINCGPGTETLTVDPNDVLNADCGAGNPTTPGGGGNPTVPGGSGAGGGSGGGGGGGTTTPPDAVAATRPGCFNIPSVARDRTVPLPGGGKLILSTRQVDDPVNPLRITARVVGARSRGIAFKVNGRAIAATGSATNVPAATLKVGSRSNKVEATVTLTSGKKATAAQLLVVLRCPLPIVTCKRATGKVTCASRTPLGALRVKASLINSAGRTVASGSAPVNKGKYTATLRGSVPPGRYQYRHVATTRKRGEKLLMVRVIAIT